MVEDSRAGVHTLVAVAVVAYRAASGSNHQHKLAVVHTVDTVVVDTVVVDMVVVDTVVVGVVVVDMDTAVSMGIAVGRLSREVVAPLDGRVEGRY